VVKAESALSILAFNILHARTLSARRQ